MNKRNFTMLLLSCSLLLAGGAAFSQTVKKLGDNSSTIVPSAVLEIESTTKGFLPPRMTSSQRNAIVSPLAGLMIYCSDCGTKGEPQFYDGAQWMSMSTVNANVNTITTLTGKTWMNKDLGARVMAGGSTDSNGYGSSFQWGRAADGHELMTWSGSTAGASNNAPVAGTSSTPTVTTNSIKLLYGSINWYTGATPAPDNLWQGVNGINNPCPSGYRLPTAPELDAERIKFKTQNADGAFWAVRFAVSGSRAWNDGSLNNVGVSGFFWSSTVSGGNLTAMVTTSTTVTFSAYSRSNGMSVRCIKD